jgi:hypothetical protein
MSSGGVKNYQIVLALMLSDLDLGIGLGIKDFT